MGSEWTKGDTVVSIRAAISDKAIRAYREEFGYGG